MEVHKSTTFNNIKQGYWASKISLNETVAKRQNKYYEKDNMICQLLSNTVVLSSNTDFLENFWYSS